MSISRCTGFGPTHCYAVHYTTKGYIIAAQNKPLNIIAKPKTFKKTASEQRLQIKETTEKQIAETPVGTAAASNVHKVRPSLVNKITITTNRPTEKKHASEFGIITKTRQGRRRYNNANVKNGATLRTVMNGTHRKDASRNEPRTMANKIEVIEKRKLRWAFNRSFSRRDCITGKVDRAANDSDCLNMFWRSPNI